MNRDSWILVVSVGLLFAGCSVLTMVLAWGPGTLRSGASPLLYALMALAGLVGIVDFILRVRRQRSITPEELRRHNWRARSGG